MKQAESGTAQETEREEKADIRENNLGGCADNGGDHSIYTENGRYKLIRCRINGVDREAVVDVRASLTDMLRNDYSLTSVKHAI